MCDVVCDCRMRLSAVVYNCVLLVVVVWCMLFVGMLVFVGVCLLLLLLWLCVVAVGVVGVCLCCWRLLVLCVGVVLFNVSCLLYDDVCCCVLLFDW